MLHKHKKKSVRRTPKSNDPYLKLLVKVPYSSLLRLAVSSVSPSIRSLVSCVRCIGDTQDESIG